MGNNNAKIGVYICHCGTNIAGKVRVGEVSNFAGKLPNVVVSREYKYMCSDPGQELIKDDIKNLGLNRIVVASCSPHLHEETFRNACKEADLNPFYFQMANIREHVSWVTKDQNAATEKAKAIVRAAVSRVRYHTPLYKKKMQIHRDVLVVGGGIAGISAALTIANSGKKVYLVERETSIGGHMAKFDKTFPTLDCSSCILTPKMTQVKNHPNIELYTYSEVLKVDGYVGNFKIKIRKKPRYVDIEKCVGCYECVEACVYKGGKFLNEFDEGLGKRKPIFIPFPQAMPLCAVIDPTACIQFKTGRCKMTCKDACGDRGAIDFNMREEIVEANVGAIIVATGFKTFDASRIPHYGYNRYDNVYTALEVERLVNSSGPTGGEIILRDGSIPKAVGIIHCVGSRDCNYNIWCSRVCCMYSLKLAHLIKERTGAEVYNFYIDIRTPGKAYEEFYLQLLQEGVHFIRGKAAEVTDWAVTPEEEGKLVIRAEDTLIGVVRRIPVDMVILSTGLQAQDDAEEVRKTFNLSCSKEGWFLERHPKLAPVATYTDGIFIAGTCQGPKDIPDSVAQAQAAAAEVMALIDKGFVELEPNVANIQPDICSGCHVCVGLCPYTAIAFNHETKIAEINPAICKGCGICAAACPSKAATQNLFTDEQIFAEIDGALF